MDFTGKKVVVMGLGSLGGGVGTARFFVKKGAHVLVTDLKDEKELKHSIDELKDYPISFSLGGHRPEDFEKADLIIKNPSVPSSSPFLAAARKNNISIEMAESLFMKLSPTQKIIGVTGTRGKSTTSQMIHDIIKAAGKKVVLGGNIKGVATLELLGQIDDSYFVVLELSSWMLEGFGWSKLSPWISVITNIYPDHLNRYTGMDEYVKDKKYIYEFQKKDDLLILNKDNSYSEGLAKEVLGTVKWFSGAGWAGILKIQGDHNKANAEAAKTVCRTIGISEDSILKTLANFHGLPHRLETIDVIDGVTYINDSASTTPIAAITALNTFIDKTIVLITGGNTKNLPTDDFINLIKTRVKHVILFDGNVLKEFDSITPKTGPYTLGRFDEVVQEAKRVATPGDIVLFSPGFSHLPVVNEFERGDLYKKAVQELQQTKN